MIDLWVKQGGKCYYTGVPMKLKGYATGDKHVATVDRIVPELGYVEGNIVLCCSIVNRIKQDLSLDELRHWVSLIRTEV